jgi:hypothetical protein
MIDRKAFDASNCFDTRVMSALGRPLVLLGLGVKPKNDTRTKTMQSKSVVVMNG